MSYYNSSEKKESLTSKEIEEALQQVESDPRTDKNWLRYREAVHHTNNKKENGQNKK